MIRRDSRGLSLIELVCVTAVVLVLAGVVIPVGQTFVKARKELELRQALREMRQAIDRFQEATVQYPGMRNELNAVNEEGFPEELEQLYQGVDIGDAAGTKLKFLRRLPVDPITKKDDWKTRSSRDRPDSMFTDGINIFDVRSSSEAVALDGTKYTEW